MRLPYMMVDRMSRPADRCPANDGLPLAFHAGGRLNQAAISAPDRRDCVAPALAPNTAREYRCARIAAITVTGERLKLHQISLSKNV